MLKVHLISCTIGDTKTLNNLSLEIFKESATKGLDTTYLSITDPAAFISCLNLKNQPLESIRLRDPILGHSFISVLVISDFDLTEEMVNGAFRVYLIRRGRFFIYILTGSILDWVNALEKQSLTNLDMISIYDTIRSEFRRTGFKELFNE